MLFPPTVTKRLSFFSLAPLAGRALAQVDVPRQVHADMEGGRLLVTPVELVQDPLKRVGEEVTSASPVGIEADLLLSGTVEEDIPDLIRQLLKRRVDVELVMVGQRVDRLEIVERVASRPGDDRPSRTEIPTSGTTSSSSKCIRVPNPPQSGQAP